MCFSHFPTTGAIEERAPGCSDMATYWLPNLVLEAGAATSSGPLEPLFKSIVPLAHFFHPNSGSIFYSGVRP